MIGSLARVCLDSCADGADTHESQTSAASAQMVSLTPDRVKGIGGAANVEVSDQLSHVGDDALHKLANLFDAYRLQHVVEGVGVNFDATGSGLESLER